VRLLRIAGWEDRGERVDRELRSAILDWVCVCSTNG